MKKITFLLLMAGFTSVSNAQTVWSTGLNGGTDLKLGTVGPQPLDFYTNGVKNMTLDYHGNFSLKSLAGTGTGLLYVDQNGNVSRTATGAGPSQACEGTLSPWYLGGNTNSSNHTIGTCTNNDFILKSNNIKSVYLKPNGFVGIGIDNNNPQAALDISDYTNFALYGGIEHFKIYGDLDGSVESTGPMKLFYKPGNQGFFVNEGVVGGTFATKLHISGGTATFNTNLSMNVPGGGSPTNAITMYDQYTGQHNFRVKSNGVVYAREVNVRVTAFPDYVFNKDYKLQSLESLQTYVNKHKHLPNVPAASEVEKDGADLGEMTRVQMEKIEELYLYIFQLKEELDSLKSEKKSTQK